MNGITHRDKTVRIVDPESSDYTHFASACQSNEFGLCFFSDAAAALRYGRHEDALLWIIGIELPDMPGIALAELLRQKSRRTLICMIGRRYDPADELLALRRGATIYVSKPLDITRLVSLAQHASALERIDASARPTTTTRVSPDESFSISQGAFPPASRRLVGDEPTESVRGPPRRP